MRFTLTSVLSIVFAFGLGSATAKPGSRSRAALALLERPAVAAAHAAQVPLRGPDVIYIPSTPELVDAMLKMANVHPGDVVYDLGCGDGRIVTAAAKEFGARGVGIDIDPERIKEATELAKREGVSDRVRFLTADLFTTDISEATVVALFLGKDLNLKLRPKLWKELKPGTRVVSNTFDMGDWAPEEKQEVDDGRPVYVWVIPPDAAKRAEQQR